MAKAFETWKVLNHGPIEKLTANVWRVEGALPNMPLKRVMTLARRADGTVVIHNAIALEDDLMREVETFGELAYLLVPNGYHRLDAGIFKARYPKLRVYCPKGARAKVAEVVDVDGTYEEFPRDERVALITLDGTDLREGALLVREPDDSTIVLNDAVFNMPHLTGAQGFVLKHITQSSGGPKVSRIARWFLIKDKKAFAAQLDRLADTPSLKRIIVSHHETISGAPGAALRAIANSLR